MHAVKLRFLKTDRSRGPHGEFLTGQRGRKLPAAAALAVRLVVVHMGKRGDSAKVSAGYPTVPKTLVVPGNLVAG